MKTKKLNPYEKLLGKRSAGNKPKKIISNEKWKKMLDDIRRKEG